MIAALGLVKPRRRFDLETCAAVDCTELVTDPGPWIVKGRDYCSPDCARGPLQDI